ncbi:MAG TPA: hypothetical protein VKM55_19045 [Candidatus Lokiarchaeia archaeon]|nr:hypothetical protein [Candidatus Lokiarchaeia archaeon]
MAIPAMIKEGNIVSALSLINEVKTTLSTLERTSKIIQNNPIYQRIAVLVENCTWNLPLMKDSLEKYLIHELQEIELYLIKDFCFDEASWFDVLARIDNDVDICDRAGLNKMLVEFAAMKKELLPYAPSSMIPTRQGQ